MLLNNVGDALDPEAFMLRGNDICKNQLNPMLSKRVMHRRFRARFGLSPQQCSDLWNVGFPNFPKKGLPKHLLWTLMLLKQCNTDVCSAGLIGVDKDTCSKWVWLFTQSSSELDLARKFNFVCVCIVLKAFVLSC